MTKNVFSNSPYPVTDSLEVTIQVSRVISYLANIDRRISNSIKLKQVGDTSHYIIQFFIDGHKFQLPINGEDPNWNEVYSLGTQVSLTYAQS